MRERTRRFVILSFSAALCALVLIAYQNQQRVELARTETAAVIDSSNGKSAAARKLRRAVIEHGATLRRLLESDDELEIAELQADFILGTSDYRMARDYLVLSALHSDERRVVDGISRRLAGVETLSAAILAARRDGTAVSELEPRIANLAAIRDGVIALVDEYINLQGQYAKGAMSAARNIHERYHGVSIVAGVAALILALIASQYLLWRSVRRTRKLAYQASHDALTSLINRAEFESRLQRAIDSVRQYHGEHALIVFDLDRFKIVNDAAGHQAGDGLLKTLARTLHRSMRQRDSLARVGGDEFAVLLDNCPLGKALDKARSIVQEIEQLGFSWKGQRFDISASLGVTLLCANDTTDSSLARADAACYRAKHRGSGEVEVAESGRQCPMYSECGSTRFPATLELLRQECYELYYQPICRSESSVEMPVQYAEILIRCRDAQGNLLLPDSFIPAAERYGLIQDIDRWVVRNTLEWLSRVQPSRNALKLSINLSGRSICDERMADYIVERFAASGVDPHNIVFEITETAAISGLQRAVGNMERLNAIGCAFSLDDFGTGLSSFSYLKNLPIDYLKIDGEFVRNIHSDDRNCSIVRLFNDIGHALGKHTVAEYVEDADTFSVLRGIGIDYLQGNAIGEPRALQALEDRLPVVA